jgi:very-short-patch-repair endonuclease
MKGNCDLVKCQVCEQEMSFGRIKNHIKARHKTISVDQYVKQYWSTLPLHKPCEVCNENIVYKYQTCSKECQSIKASNERKGKPKPEGFMSDEHKFKISKSMIGKIGGFNGHKHSEEHKLKMSLFLTNKKIHLNHKHSEETKDIQSQKRKKWFADGNEPWTKNNKHTSETIKKIFSKRPMNKLEKFVSNILDENNIKYTHQFFLNKDGICKSYDFKIKDTNILLEIDGDYWHGGPSLEKHFFKLEEVKQNDIFKDQLAKDNGFNLLRIWESDIYNKPSIVVDKIKENT